MKKLLGLLLLFIFSFSLVGCFDIYEDKSKRDMELVDVKIYDKDNNEIKGTYKNFFGERSPKNKNTNLDKLNSAAPVFNYYVIDVSLNESYTIKIYFYSQKGFNLTKITLFGEDSSLSDEKYEVTDIVKEDKNYVATFTVDNVTESNNFYYVGLWYKGDMQYHFGTMGSNTYIKGAYLELPKEEENTGWTY